MDTNGFETVQIPKTGKVCPMCEDYAARQSAKPVVVACCEGACLRGEIARRAANVLCHELACEKTARLCLGGAFTKDTGQRALARNAQRLVIIEGCFLECGSRMLRGVLPGAAPEVIVADRLCEFDRKLFGIDEMDEDEIRVLGRQVAAQVMTRI